MSACRRWAAAIGVASLGLLAAGAAARLLAWPVGDTLPRLGVALGAAGLPMALLLWFWPGGLNDGAPPALARRYYREFLPPMAAYVVVMLAWRRLLDAVDAHWLRVVVAVLPALAILLAMRAVARYVRDTDEMQRRIELESIAIAAGLVGAGYMIAGFLQGAGLIAVAATASMLWVFPALCLCYGVVKLFVLRRYA